MNLILRSSSSKLTTCLYVDGSHFKPYLSMRGLGPNVVPVIWPTRVSLLDFFYSGIQYSLGPTIKQSAQSENWYNSGILTLYAKS